MSIVCVQYFRQTSTSSYHASHPVQVFTSNDPESEVALWSGLLFLLGVVSGIGIFIKACIILFVTYVYNMYICTNIFDVQMYIVTPLLRNNLEFIFHPVYNDVSEIMYLRKTPQNHANTQNSVLFLEVFLV